MTCHEHDLSLVDNHVCIKMNAPMCQQDQCANVSRAHQMVQKCEKAEMVQNVKRKRKASTCAVLSLTCRFSPQVQAKTSAGVDVLESLSRQVPGGKDISQRHIAQSLSKDNHTVYLERHMDTLCLHVLASQVSIMSLPLKCPLCVYISLPLKCLHVLTCPCLSSPRLKAKTDGTLSLYMSASHNHSLHTSISLQP